MFVIDGFALDRLLIQQEQVDFLGVYGGYNVSRAGACSALVSSSYSPIT